MSGKVEILKKRLKRPKPLKHVLNKRKNTTLTTNIFSDGTAHYKSLKNNQNWYAKQWY